VHGLPVQKVVFASHIIDSLLTYSRMAYPNEGILILRGKSKKGVVEITSVMVPPAAVHAHSYSSFNWFMLPVDMSYMGVTHQGTPTPPMRTSSTQREGSW